MRPLVYKILAVSIGIFALGYSAAFAQSPRDIEKNNLSVFTGITLGGDFTLEVNYGSQYAAKLTTEEMLADYVQFSVSDGKLSVSVDERKVPAEVKRLFRGKNAATYRLIVTMPEGLRAVNLSDKAIFLSADDRVFHPESVELNVKENAKIGTLKFTSDRVSVKMERKAEATLEVTCDSLDVDMSGSTNLTLIQHAEKVGYALAFNSNLVVSGETESLSLSAKGTSKAILNGTAPVASFKVTNASNVNAVNLEVEEARVEMNGLCTLTQAATQDLFVNIGSGSTLVFKNEPTFHILNVKSASLTPYDKKK
jgi:Protein of unknown function (DUF2807).